MDQSLIKGDIGLIHHDRTELTMFVQAMTLLKQIVINNTPCMVLNTITTHLILGSRDWIISSQYPRRNFFVPMSMCARATHNNQSHVDFMSPEGIDEAAGQVWKNIACAVEIL